MTIAAAGFRPTTLQYPTTGTDSSRVITDSYGTSGGMDDQINQLEAVVDGSGTADDPTVGERSTTSARWVTGRSSPSSTSAQVEYNLLGTTTIGGVATPNLDQFNRIQNLIWSNYGTSTTAAGNEYQRNLQGDVSVNINAVDAAFSEMYTNDEADQLTSLTRGTISGRRNCRPRHSRNPLRPTATATTKGTRRASREPPPLTRLGRPIRPTKSTR